MKLGIDIGGTSIKFGVVSPGKPISDYRKYYTHEFTKDKDFTQHILEVVGDYLETHKNIEGIGIGVPGLLSQDKRTILSMPNIPGIIELNIVEAISNRFEGTPVLAENDANCAALGEYYYGKRKEWDNFLLMTLGTGIGSGAVMNGELFNGGRGNGMEAGHILIGRSFTLEQQIGKQGIINYVHENLKKLRFRRSPLKEKSAITPSVVFEAAQNEDTLALSTFNYVGQKLGQALVTIIRITDVTNILIGGGVAGAFDYFAPTLLNVLEENLPDYYLKDIVVEKATLGEQAGVLGAASLLSANRLKALSKKEKKTVKS
ncbi:MAG: ROK family protein [Bacteroidota bacterium]